MATKKKTAPKVFATNITAPNGKRVYVRGRTKEEFEKKVMQARIDIQAGIDITNDTTFGAYATTWLNAYKKGRVRPTTYTLHETLLRLHVLPYFGEMRLKDVRPTQIQMYVGALPDELSHSTKSKCLQLVRAIFQAAADDGLINKSPVRSDVKIPAEATAEEQPLTDEQSRRLLAALEGTKAYTFCLIALSTGMRRGEILGLMWDDVDFKKGVIHVRHNKAFPMSESDAPVTELLKTEAARRDLPLGQCLREHLYSLRAESDSPYVLAMENGNSLTKCAFRSMWGAVGRRTAGKGRVQRDLGESYGGMKVTLDFDVHPHLLRHTYITKLFEQGLDIKQVQYLAGHSTPDMTMRVYTHYRQSQRSAETHDQVLAALDYLSGVGA
jgi:integrase